MRKTPSVETGFQTVDKVPAIAGLFYIYNRFSDIIKILERRCFFMMTKNADKKREQMLMFCMDDMVPQDHMLLSRKLNDAPSSRLFYAASDSP